MRTRDASHRDAAAVNADCISCRTDRFLLMIPAFLLVFSAAAYRVTTGLLIHSGATWLSNFTPLAAIALCSAAYFPGKYKFSDRKSTRLNSSHLVISYAVFCLKKKSDAHLG